MKFKNITTEVKFKYLSSRALGSKQFDEICDYTTKYFETGYSWYPPITYLKIEQLNQPKAIVIPASYKDSEIGKRGEVVPFISNDEVIDCSNFIFEGRRSFANFLIDESYHHKNKVIKNYTGSITWLVFGNDYVEEIYNVKGTDSQYGIFENATNVRIIENFDMADTTTDGQLFNGGGEFVVVLGLKNVHNNLDISPLISLPKEQVIRLFNEGIITLPEGTTKIITLPSHIKSVLTEDERKIATDKGWTLA